MNIIRKAACSLISALAVLLSVADTASAQTSAKYNDQPRFQIGLNAALPVGLINRISTIGTGIDFRYEYPVLDGRGALTADLAGTYFFPRDRDGSNIKLSFTDLDIKGGLKYYLSDFFYVMGEVGLGYYITSIAPANSDLHDELKSSFNSKAGFVYAPAIGYIIPTSKSYFDVSVRFQGSTASWKSASSNSTTIGTFAAPGPPNTFAIRVAYNLK